LINLTKLKVLDIKLSLIPIERRIAYDEVLNNSNYVTPRSTWREE